MPRSPSDIRNRDKLDNYRYDTYHNHKFSLPKRVPALPSTRVYHRNVPDEKANSSDKF